MQRSLTAAVLFITIILASFAPLAGATQPAVVTVGLLNLRSGPGTGFSVVASLPLDTELIVIGSQGEWRQVQSRDQKSGWVFGPFIKDDPAFVSEQSVLQVRSSTLNVRLGPDTRYPVIGVVRSGQILSASGRIGGWFRVVVGGRTGFVHYNYVEVVEDGSSPALPVGVPLARTNVGTLNLRVGPGLQYPVVARLSQGTLLAVAEEGTWARVFLQNGVTGFVASEYIVPIDGEALAVVSTSAANQRTGPGTQYSVMTTHTAGQTLPFLGFDSGWVKVSSAAGEGYILGSLLSFGFAGGGTRLPERIADLTGFKVMIDPGHGGGDPGAIGINGLYEKTVNLDISLKLAELLRRAGAEVVMTRTTDVHLTLAQRVDLINGSGADIAISVHNNAHTNRSVSGTQVFYGVTKGSFELGHAVHREMVALGLRDRGLLTASFRVLQQSNIPTILTEGLFLSNREDAALLAQDSFLDRIAMAHFNGISDYLTRNR